MTNSNVSSSPMPTAPIAVTPSVAPAPEKSQRKKTPPIQLIFGFVALVVLVLGGVVGFVLMSGNTELRQQAAGPLLYPSISPSAQPSPTGGGTGTCSTTNVTAPPGGCIAIHMCDVPLSGSECTVLHPQVVSGSVNPQQIANDNCKCVQADALNGLNNSCVNGHINGDPSTMTCGIVVCPTNCGNPSPRPTPSPGSSPPPSPQPSPPPSINPTPTPVPTPSPGSSPPPPACMHIVTNHREIHVGDDVTFTCGTVSGVSKYEFRVRLPDGSFQTLPASTTEVNVSTPFTVTQLGNHQAQCRICVGAQQTCQEWEAL